MLAVTPTICSGRQWGPPEWRMGMGYEGSVGHDELGPSLSLLVKRHMAGIHSRRCSVPTDAQLTLRRKLRLSGI
jgi:hypothetical protein